MRLTWLPGGWEDYLYWQKEGRKTLKRINGLICECLRDPFEGTGKAERLKGNLSGWWSRRITSEHRLVYRVDEDAIIILQCRFHYDD